MTLNFECHLFLVSGFGSTEKQVRITKSYSLILKTRLEIIEEMRSPKWKQNKVDYFLEKGPEHEKSVAGDTILMYFYGCV